MNPLSRPRANSAPPIARMPSPPAYAPQFMPRPPAPQRYFLEDIYEHDLPPLRSWAAECAAIGDEVSCGVIGAAVSWARSMLRG